MKKTCLLIIFIGLTSWLSAQNNPHTGFQGNSLLNVFIAQHSFDRIEWQRDLRLLPPSPAPETNLVSGELLGESLYTGYYAYQPAVWAELSEAEREDVLTDPRLLPWLTWFNGKMKPVSGIQMSQAERDLLAQTLHDALTAPVEQPREAEVFGDYGKFTYRMQATETTANTPLYLKLVSREKLPRIEEVEPESDATSPDPESPQED